MKEVVTRYQTLKSDRTVWNALLEDIRTYIYPTTTSFIQNNQGDRGLDLNRKIYDPTGERAHADLVGAIMSGMTNSASRWFYYSVVDDRIMAQESNKHALERATKQCLSILGNTHSNFYSAIHEGYYELTGLGTGVLFKRGKGSSSRFRCIPLAEVFFEEDDYGTVDTAYRAVFMTAKQVYDQFGTDLSEEVKMVLDAKIHTGPSNRLEVIHCVRPNKRYRKKDSLAKTNKAFESVYVLSEGNHTLEVSGYDKFPYYVCRWETIAGREVLGRGPGMRALKDAKVLNQMSKTLLEAGEVSVRPSMQFPFNAFMNNRLNLSPLAQNPYQHKIGLKDPTAKPLVTVGNLPIGLEMENQRRRAIQESFFIDLLNEDKKQRMTNLETAQREQARLGRMAPQMSRIQGEWLAPIVLDLFSEMLDEELIEVPEAIINAKLKLVFNSPLTRAQKQTEATGFQRFLNNIAALGQVFPEVLQVPKPLKLVETLREIEEIDPDSLRNEEEVMAALQQQQQTAQAKEEAAIAEQASKAGLNIAEIQEKGAVFA